MNKKCNTLLNNIRDYVAKYPSIEDAPIDEYNSINEQIADQSNWINDINNAYEVARDRIIDSIGNDIIKKYAQELMDSLSPISRLAALEEGEKILNNVRI